VIHITISRKELVALGACLRGLEWFDSIASSGVWSSDWTPLHDVWIRKSEWCGWLVVKKLIPIANLQGADLRWAGLLGADLRGANLEGADLEGADLRGADLEWANLGGADLEWANLQCANLGGANLRGAKLEGANLGDWERGPDGLARRKT